MYNGNIPPQGYNQPNYQDPQAQWVQQQNQPKKKGGWLKVAGITALSVFALGGLVQCVGGTGTQPNPTPTYPTYAAPTTTQPTTAPSTTTAPATTPSTTKTPEPTTAENVEAIKDAWGYLDDEKAKRDIVDGWKAAKAGGYEDAYLDLFVSGMEKAVMSVTGRQLTKAEAREFLEWAEQQ